MASQWMSKWVYRETAMLPRGFRYTIFEMGDVIAWMKEEQDADFLCRARRNREGALMQKAYDEMDSGTPVWVEREAATLPRGFRHVILANREVIAWVKSLEHARFMTDLSRDLKETKNRLRKAQTET